MSSWDEHVWAEINWAWASFLSGRGTLAELPVSTGPAKTPIACCSFELVLPREQKFVTCCRELTLSLKVPGIVSFWRFSKMSKATKYQLSQVKNDRALPWSSRSWLVYLLSHLSWLLGRIVWAMPCEDLWRFVRHHWKAKLLLISEQETSEFSGLESVTHIRESFDPDRTDLPLVLQQSYLNSCRCRMYEDMNYWINCAWLTIGFIWILNGLLGGTCWCGTRMHTDFLTRKRIPFLYGHLVHWRCLCFSHSCNLPLAACRQLILLMGLIYIAFCEQTLAFFCRCASL